MNIYAAIVTMLLAWWWSAAQIARRKLGEADRDRAMYQEAVRVSLGLPKGADFAIATVVLEPEPEPHLRLVDPDERA